MFDSVLNFFATLFSKITTFFSSAYDLVLVLVILTLSFVTFKFLKYLTVPGIILGQIIFLTISITSMMTFVALLSTSLVAIYNRIYLFVDTLGGLTSSSPCFSHFLSVLGIDSILSAYFTELFAILITVLLIRISSYILWAFNFISERIWRIGVLLGLV